MSQNTPDRKDRYAALSAEIACGKTADTGQAGHVLEGEAAREATKELRSRPGRPSLGGDDGKSCAVSTRLPEADVARLKTAAAEAGITQTEFIRDAVLAALAAPRPPVPAPPTREMVEVIVTEVMKHFPTHEATASPAGGSVKRGRRRQDKARHGS